MTNKYKRGRIVRSIADFSTCKAEMFWIEQGHIVRHRSWLISWQYHYLEMMIKRGYIFIAERIEEENSHEHNT